MNHRSNPVSDADPVVGSREAALRLLMLEDEPYDAELAQLELTRYGLTFAAVQVVAAEDEYVAALRAFTPDVILADYRLPGMTGDLALEHAQAICPQVPFVVVSGTLGREQAAVLLQRGARDYVLKNQISRLGPTVARVVAEVLERRRSPAERAGSPQRPRPAQDRPE